jgi:dienelactone hydrolase
LPRFWREAPDTAASWFLTTFLWRNPERIRAHSFDDANLSSASPSYPVVLLRSGIGATAVDYTTLAEDLASHGYVVVSVDAPYSTWAVVMPDGRVIHKTDRGNPGDAPVSEADRERMLADLLKVWVEDTRFLLDEVAALNEEAAGRFSGRLDLDAVGVVGHSFGGATAARVCHVDERCRTGIDIDGALHAPVMTGGIGRPFLFLLSDHTDLSDPAERAIMDEIRSVADQEPGGGLIVSFIGAHHFSFTDTPLTQSRILRSLLVALGGPGGGLDPRLGLAMTTRYVRAFLDVHLRGSSPDTLYSVPLMAGATVGVK